MGLVPQPERPFEFCDPVLVAFLRCAGEPGRAGALEPVVVAGVGRAPDPVDEMLPGERKPCTASLNVLLGDGPAERGEALAESK